LAAAPAPTPAPLTYSAAQWEEECLASFGEGRDPAPCPDCGRTGFYGPRIDATERHYRQCRFCGFSQMVGEAPVRHRPTVHGCQEWPDCARAPYVWWVSQEVESYLCPFCGKRVRVDQATVPRPVDDPSHAWWKVPQHRKRSYYLRFWENWDVTRGRVHL
jgi:hypothetical protein